MNNLLREDGPPSERAPRVILKLSKPTWEPSTTNSTGEDGRSSMGDCQMGASQASASQASVPRLGEVDGPAANMQIGTSSKTRVVPHKYSELT